VSTTFFKTRNLSHAACGRKIFDIHGSKASVENAGCSGYVCPTCARIRSWGQRCGSNSFHPPQEASCTSW
jgi:hypothetical protein